MERRFILNTPKRRSPWVAVVGVSVALHVGLLFALGTEAPPVVRQNHPLVWVDTVEPLASVKPPEPAPKPPTPPPAPARVNPPKSVEKSASAKPGGTPPAQAPGTTEAASPSAEASVTSHGDVPMAPKSAPSLVPGAAWVLKQPAQPREDSGRGTTVSNGPGEEPDPVAAKEYEGETLTRKLNNDLQGEVGAAAVAVGNVPGHFLQTQNALRDALKHAKVDMTEKSSADVARDVASLLFLQPGVSAEAARKVTDSPLGQSIAHNTVPTPNIEDARFRESAAQMMAATEALKEKMHAVQLRTVLEMTTTPEGAIADVSVVEKSGDVKFDESVLHLSRKVVRKLTENDDKRLGTSWWKSKWQFTFEPPEVRVKLLEAHRVAAPIPL